MNKKGKKQQKRTGKADKPCQPFTRKLSNEMMGQVFWLAFNLVAFPSAFGGQWRKKPVAGTHGPIRLTATGIAPEFHRTSLLIRRVAEPSSLQM